jgi:solute carrier family 50 protein (sugar transporter)
MSGVGEVFLNVVAPVIGLTLANVMFFSGVPAMLRCKREGSLGDMNPGPFPVVLANCVGWMGYSLLIHDYFLFFGNAPASMVGMYFTLVGYGLSAPASETRRTMERLVMGLMGATLAVVFYLGMVAVDTGATAGQISEASWVCSATLCFFCTTPCRSPPSAKCWRRATRDRSSRRWRRRTQPTAWRGSATE